MPTAGTVAEPLALVSPPARGASSAIEVITTGAAVVPLVTMKAPSSMMRATSGVLILVPASRVRLPSTSSCETTKVAPPAPDRCVDELVIWSLLSETTRPRKSPTVAAKVLAVAPAKLTPDRSMPDRSRAGVPTTVKVLVLAVTVMPAWKETGPKSRELVRATVPDPAPPSSDTALVA